MPKTDQEEADDNRAYLEWTQGFYTHLGTFSNPAFLQTAGWYWLTRGNDKVRAEQLFARAAKLPDLDAPSLFVTAVLCTQQLDWNLCAGSDWNQRLLAADPGNAAVYLLQMRPAAAEPEPDSKQKPSWDTPENRAWLTQAAAANTLTYYWGAHGTSLFRAARDYQSQHPYPSPNPELVDAQQASSAASVDWGLVSALFAALEGPLRDPGYRFGAVIQLCKSQFKQGSPELLKSCQELAELAWTASREFVQMELAREQFRMRDEVTGKQDYAALLQNSQQLQMCQAPAWQTQNNGLQRISEDSIRLLLAEIEQFGEIEAMRRAAIRDFETHPEAYASNPADCNDFELPSIDWALNE